MTEEEVAEEKRKKIEALQEDKKAKESSQTTTTSSTTTTANEIYDINTQKPIGVTTGPDGRSYPPSSNNNEVWTAENVTQEKIFGPDPRAYEQDQKAAEDKNANNTIEQQ